MYVTGGVHSVLEEEVSLLRNHIGLTCFDQVILVDSELVHREVSLALFSNVLVIVQCVECALHHPMDQSKVGNDSELLHLDGLHCRLFNVIRGLLQSGVFLLECRVAEGKLVLVIDVLLAGIELLEDCEVKFNFLHVLFTDFRSISQVTTD